MYVVEADQARRVFVIHLRGQVKPLEVTAGLKQLEVLLQDAAPGFVLLADFCGVDSMMPETSQQIGRVMDLLARHGVGLIVRVMPDPCKDVGLNILSRFHYGAGVEIATVRSLAEAIALLLKTE